jgi:predicted small integral membrane protein
MAKTPPSARCARFDNKIQADLPAANSMVETMIVVRLSKTALVAAIALFFMLVAFGNLTDYDSNWQFVQHVLSMDTTFPNSSLHWRAITDPAIQAAGYWMIIAAEILAAVLLCVAAVMMLVSIHSAGFHSAKAVAVGGLSLGVLLYAVGFVAIGGEWFAMWQSQIWNGEQKAFDFIGMIGIVLVIVLLPEDSRRTTPAN